jgi:hypothetical protein
LCFLVCFTCYSISRIICLLFSIARTANKQTNKPPVTDRLVLLSGASSGEYLFINRSVGCSALGSEKKLYCCFPTCVCVCVCVCVFVVSSRGAFLEIAFR